MEQRGSMFRKQEEKKERESKCGKWKERVVEIGERRWEWGEREREKREKGKNDLRIFFTFRVWGQPEKKKQRKNTYFQVLYPPVKDHYSGN